MSGGVIESITTWEGRGNPIRVSKIHNFTTRLAESKPRCGDCKYWIWRWDYQVPPATWWLIIFLLLAKYIKPTMKVINMVDFHLFSPFWCHLLVTKENFNFLFGGFNLVWKVEVPVKLKLVCGYSSCQSLTLLATSWNFMCHYTIKGRNFLYNITKQNL